MNPQEAKKLEAQILEIISKYLDDETVIAGISGGPDSIFLLHLLNQTNCTVLVAHLNHKLRKKESDQDEDFVRALTSSTEQKFYTKKVDIEALSKEKKQGLEETGRQERYKFFNKLAKDHKAKYIITAHHADDNLETILLNLARGANLKGLSGMQTIQGNLFRPLLDISKSKILDYLDHKKIAYRTDESNKDDIYNRNHVRLNIVPELKKINPSITETLAKNTKNLREIEDYLNKEAIKYATKTLDAKEFRKLHPAIQKQTLIQIHQNLTGTTKNLENIHLEEILTLINNNIGNKKKRLGKLIITIKNNKVSIEKSPETVQYKQS